MVHISRVLTWSFLLSMLLLTPALAQYVKVISVEPLEEKYYQVTYMVSPDCPFQDPQVRISWKRDDGTYWERYPFTVGKRLVLGKRYTENTWFGGDNLTGEVYVQVFERRDGPPVLR